MEIDPDRSSGFAAPRRGCATARRATGAVRRRAARPIARAAAALALAALGACASRAPAPAAPAPQAVVERAGARAVDVSDAQSGAEVVLEPGQRLVVRLANDATSGLDWTLVDPPSGVLVARGSGFEFATRDPDVEQSAGARVWRFDARQRGSVTLRFDLRRPRSLVPAQRSVSYAVSVR